MIDLVGSARDLYRNIGLHLRLFLVMDVQACDTRRLFYFLDGKALETQELAKLRRWEVIRPGFRHDHVVGPGLRRRKRSDVVASIVGTRNGANVGVTQGSTASTEATTCPMTAKSAAATRNMAAAPSN